MKNKLFILSIFILLLLSGCYGNITMEDSSTQTEVEDKTGMIDLSDDLVWDKNTHIVYIKQHTYRNEIYIPYPSKNGKHMRYEDGKFVETEE